MEQGCQRRAPQRANLSPCFLFRLGGPADARPRGCGARELRRRTPGRLRCLRVPETGQGEAAPAVPPTATQQLPVRRANVQLRINACMAMHCTQVIARARFNDRRMVADLREPSPSNRSIRLSLITSPMCLPHFTPRRSLSLSVPSPLSPISRHRDGGLSSADN